MEHLGLTDVIDAVYGTNVHPWRKPQPEFTQFVLSSFKARAENTMMVGDSPFDIATARNGKLAAIHCVTTGSHTAEELAPYAPDTVHAGLPELGREVFGLG